MWYSKMVDFTCHIPNSHRFSFDIPVTVNGSCHEMGFVLQLLDNQGTICLLCIRVRGSLASSHRLIFRDRDIPRPRRHVDEIMLIKISSGLLPPLPPSFQFGTKGSREKFSRLWHESLYLVLSIVPRVVPTITSC